MFLIWRNENEQSENENIELQIEIVIDDFTTRYELSNIRTECQGLIDFIYRYIMYVFLTCVNVKNKV